MADPTTISMEEARVELTDLSRRILLNKERFIVTFHGKPMFAMVPVEEVKPSQPPVQRIRRTRPRFTQ